MLGLLKCWWYQRLIKLDVKILWPSIKNQTPNISKAREAFYIHVMTDPVYKDMSPTEITKFVEKLK